MKTRLFTTVEIKKLELNPFVIKIKYKREIEYDPIFKLWTVIQKKERPDLSSKEIFELAKFDTSLLSEELPRRRISHWTKKYNKFGIDYFLPTNNAYEINETIREDIKKFLDSLGIK